MAEGKKGLSPLAWVGIGCGALLVLGGIALAIGIGFVGHKAKQFAGNMEDKPVETTARLIARLNPDIDYVSSDEESQTVTLLNKKTGQEMTFDFQDIKDGKVRWNTGDGDVEISTTGSGDEGGITVTSDQGTAKFGAGATGDDELPDWVPVCSGATDFDLVYVTEDSSSRAGTYSIACPGSLDEALDEYKVLLENGGFEVSRHVVSLGDQGKQGVVQGEDKANNRTVVVTLTTDDAASKGLVQYSEKN